MATTYTGNYQIKKIGTGEEASTWGVSTNDTWKKVEQMVGGGSIVTITATANGSTWVDETKTLTWITTNTSSTGDGGSKGRAAFVEFIGSPGADSKVIICGNDSTLPVERVFFVYNNLADGFDITLQAVTATTTYVVKNGARAIVYVNGTDKVTAVLDTFQVSKLDFRSSGSGIVELQDDTDNAFNLKEGVNSYVNVNTTAKSVIIGAATGSDCELLDVRTTEGINLNFTDQADIFIEDGKAASLRFRGYAGTDDYITLNTSTKSIELGDSAVNILDIDTSAITTTTQATTWELKPSSVALNFRDGGVSFLKLDTTPATNKVTITGDCAITGTLDITGDVMGSTTYDGTVIINTATAIDVTNQASHVLIKDHIAAAFVVKEASNAYLTLNTTNSFEKVVIGQVAAGGPIELDIDVATITVGSQPTGFSIKDDEATALNFTEGANSYLNFRTTTANPRVEFGKNISGAGGGTLTTVDNLTVGADLTVTSDVTINGFGTSNNAITVNSSSGGHIEIPNAAQFRSRANPGVSDDIVSLIQMGASNTIAIGEEVHTDNVVLRCATDDFDVAYNDGNKAIWHNDTAAFSTVNVNASWELAVSSATALQIKDSGVALLTVDTAAPKVAIDCNLNVDGNVNTTGNVNATTGTYVANAAGRFERNVGGDAWINVANINGSNDSLFLGSANADTGTAPVVHNANHFLILQVSQSGTDPKNQFKVTYDGAGTNHTIWHAGNDGVDSGLDADTVDTLQAKAIFSGAINGDGFYVEKEFDPVATSGSVAHGLGSMPKLVAGFIVCTSAEAGFAIGDQVGTGSTMFIRSSGNQQNGKVLVGSEGSGGDLFYTCGASWLILENKGTGVPTFLTKSSWKVVIRAWK